MQVDLDNELTEPGNPESGEVAKLPQRKRHDRIADKLLEDYKRNQQGDGNNQQRNDEWRAPAIVTTAGQDELQEDKTPRGQDASDVIHLGLVVRRHVLGDDNRSQDAEETCDDHDQVENVSPPQRGGEEATDEETSAEANGAGGRVDGQRPRPVCAGEVGTDDADG